MNEFELIERYFHRTPRHADVRIGIGDDGAVIAPQFGCEYVISVDMLVEGRHFTAGADPRRLGHKTLAVNLSDLAAMGALPRFALLAGALPDSDPAWLQSFIEGFDALARQHDVDLIGGDTTRGPRNLCVTAIGELPQGTALTRAGARAGDVVYVSGTLGDAALALAVAERRTTVDATVAPALARRLDMPEPRVALGLALRGIASAALDLSDGLTGDLGHILSASCVGGTLDLPAIPCSDALRAKLTGSERELALRCLLAGGDDYELCFTVPHDAQPQVTAISRALGLALTPIGRINAQPGLEVRNETGTALRPLPGAYDHFRSS